MASPQRALRASTRLINPSLSCPEYGQSRAENKGEHLTTSDELLRFKLDFLEASISHSPSNI